MIVAKIKFTLVSSSISLAFVKASVVLGFTNFVVIHLSITYVMINIRTRKKIAVAIPAFFSPRIAVKKKIEMYIIPNTERFRRYL